MKTFEPEERGALLRFLVSAVPNQRLGRTALMKLMYFIQELKGVPLGYRFSLYTYGPFDSGVLSDLDAARSLGWVSENAVLYNRGYGYEIALSNTAEAETPPPPLPTVAEEAARDVVAELGSLNASELELRSTILFVDRELAKTTRTQETSALVKRVRVIKPHFSEDQVTARTNEMRAKGWLQTLPAPDSVASF